MLGLASSRPLGQGGFTLIELVIGMVLTCMVLAVAGRMLVDGMQTQETAGSSQRAASAAATTLNQIGGDLRSALSPIRVSDEAPTKVLMRAAIWDGQSTEDFRDIVVADPHQLWFRSDVVPETSSEPIGECVGYVMSAAGLTRHVDRNWQDCPSASPDQSTVLVPPGLPSATLPTPFTYNLRSHRPDPTKPGTPDNCETSTMSDPASGDDLGNPHDLYLIASVSIDLNAMVVREQSLGTASLRDTFALRTRTGNDYQYAVGCAV